MFNFAIDPYGYNSRDKKFIKNLSMVNKPHIVNARLNSDGYYYLIGTSRMVRLNPNTIESITNKKTHNIKINGSTLIENSLLARRVKDMNKNFIYGFDAFSLNKTRNKFNEINNRYKAYKQELSKGNIFKYFFNSDITIKSIQHLIKQWRKYDYNKKHTEENNAQYQYNLKSVNNHTGLDNKRDKTNFSNYKIYPEKNIVELAKLGSLDDIFIIFPQHIYYYQLFAKYQNIEKQYFRAIKLLVQNTNAQVWSFYGANTITKDKSNFDKNGWHFKPKIGDMVFQKIFEKNQEKIPDNFGILLTKDNINSYLNTISEQVKGLNFE